MLSFLVALGIIVGIVSGCLSIYQFIRSRQGRGIVYAVVAIGLILAAVLFANFPSPSGARNVGTNPGSTGSTQQGKGITPTPSPSPTPTPTPSSFPKPGTVLYQEDGSDNWQGWSGDQAWKVLNHFLLNDGTSDNFSRIIAPYQVAGTADYAVEATFQVVSYEHRVSYPCFGIAVRGMSTAAPTRGYHAVIGCFSDLTDVELQDDEKTLATAPFNPGNNWHTYRIEVKGNNIKFFVDGGLKIVLTDNKFLDGGEVGLFDTQVQLEVSSFKVIAM